MTDLKPVLTWVNQEREKRGMEPLERLPKGVPVTERACPLAKALDDWMGEDCFPGADGRTTEDLPLHVQRFIRDFDNGKYPELVA